MWSRRMVGHSITDHLRATAVVDALEMALVRRAVRLELIVHSDRGKQYAEYRVRDILSSNSMIQSMSSPGNCYDNAMAESFFATLKKVMCFSNVFKREKRSDELFLNIWKCSTTACDATHHSVINHLWYLNNNKGYWLNSVYTKRGQFHHTNCIDFPITNKR
jgi:transposase InsO family protein